MEVAPGGGSDRPEPDAGAEGVLFVVEGELTRHARRRRATCCSPAAMPSCRPASGWTRAQRRRRAGALPLDPQGLRARSTGIDAPEADLRQRAARSSRSPMPGTDGRWATTRFVDPADLRHDMHVTIVTLEPGARHPLRRDACDGARPLRARGQGGLPAQPGLGRGRGRRLSCGCAPSARRPAMPAARAIPLPALQGRQPPREARSALLAKPS